MKFCSQASRLLALGLVAAQLSIPLSSSLASELGERHPYSPSALWARSDESQYNTSTEKLKKKYHAKKETAKLKTIHGHNVRHHKKEKIKRLSSKGRCYVQKKKNNKSDEKIIHHKNKKDQDHSSLPSSYHSEPTKSDSNNPSDSSQSSLPSSQGLNSLIHVTSACGKPQPTASITESSGPNGRESFLNCGITEKGWNPPDVTMSMITSTSLDEEHAKSTFAPCSEYRSLFEKYGKEYSIPPIFLAAFAMQESTCRPSVVGDNGGAFGLMQITKDKCGGAPDGNCADPDYNVKMGAKTFADGLKEYNGNVLKALGSYNGWTPGLTKGQAMKAKSEGCCVCQQNLDYLHQFLNGWIQGIDPQLHRLGTVRNLDACGSQE